MCEIPLPNQGSPSSSDGKGSVSNAGDPGSIPGSGRSPREGNGNPLQYPWTEEPGGLQFMVVVKSDMTERLTHTHKHTHTHTHKPGQVWFTWMRKRGMGPPFKIQH